MFGVAVTLVGVLSCVLLAPVKVTGCDRTRDEFAEWDNDGELEPEPLTDWQTVDAPPGLKDVPPQLFLPFLDTRSQMSVALAFTRYKSPLLDILTDRFIESKKMMQDRRDTVRVLKFTDGTRALFERRFDDSTPGIIVFLGPGHYLLSYFQSDPPVLDGLQKPTVTVRQIRFNENHPNGEPHQELDADCFAIWFDSILQHYQPYKGWMQTFTDLFS